MLTLGLTEADQRAALVHGVAAAFGCWLVALYWAEPMLRRRAALFLAWTPRRPEWSPTDLVLAAAVTAWCLLVSAKLARRRWNRHATAVLVLLAVLVQTALGLHLQDGTPSAWILWL